MSSPSGSGGLLAEAGSDLTPSDPAWIGGYRLLRRLGAGGMGLVYLAETAPSGRPVAVKVIRPEYADDPVYRQRFRREAEAAARVRDPGVARVLDHCAGTTDGSPPPYLVTEYVPGESLRDRISATGPLRGAELDAFAVGVAAALAAVHAAGVVHRDVKPANVLLSPSGPRLVDFGIARALDALTRYTTTGEVMGSAGWMAPEVLRQEPGTPASDVFGWGATVAFAATGRRPFGEGPDVSVAHRVLAGPPPDLDGIPAHLAPLVVAALAPDPARRPPAAALAAGRLPAPVPDRTRGLPAPAPTRLAPAPTRLAPVPARPPGRRRRRTILTGAAGVVGVLALLGALSQHQAPDLTAGGRTPRTATTPHAARTTSAVRPKPTTTPAAEPGVLVAAHVRAAQDGDVVFTLTDLRCGLTRVGRGARAQDEPAGRRACVAHVAVRNTAGGRHLLPGQTLHGSDGRDYGSNGWLAPRYGRPGIELAVLGPRATLTSTLVWELPAGVRPVAVEFHGDLISLGTRRSLR